MHPDNDQWQQAVQHLLAVRRPEQAERLIHQHLAQHPRDAFAHMLLALALFQQQRLPEAAEAANGAIRLNPRDSEGYYMLSLVQANAAKAALSETNIREALRLNPINSKYLGHLAWLLNNVGQSSEAQTVAETGLRYNPTHLECLAQLANALRSQQQWERLRYTLQQLVKLQPQLPFAHQMLGEEALRQEDFAQAQAHYEEALRLAPMDTDAHRGLSHALRYQTKMGRWAQALDRYLTFVSDGTKNRELRAWGHFLLILIPLSLLCIPLLLFIGIEALYWRLHPEIRQLRNRPAGSTSYARETIYRYGTSAASVFLLIAFLPPCIWFFLWIGVPDSTLGPGLTSGLTVLVISIGQALTVSGDLPVPEKSPIWWLLAAALCLVASLTSSMNSSLWPWGPPVVLLSDVLLLYWLLRSLRQTD